MRWPKPEILISALALGVSAMSFAGSSVWDRAAEREDAVRTERRAAYSALLGLVQRCGLNDSFDESEATALGDDVGEEGYEQRLDGFRTQAEQYVDECTAELNAASGVIELLAEDQEVIDAAWDVQQSANATLGGSLRLIEAVAEGPRVATPDEPVVITVNALREHRDSLRAGLKNSYVEFRVVARADAQEPAPGLRDYAETLLLWLIVAIVIVAPLVAIGAGVAVVVQIIVVLTHRDRPKD